MAFTLVLGGARSGKTTYAQREAESALQTDGRLVMIATAEAMDAEMTARIERHQQERGDRWTTVEAPVDLAPVIAALTANDIAVVDCLTLWLSNLLMRGTTVEESFDNLEHTLKTTPARVWLVSNETGLGIVPDNALARQFRDHSGRLHQRLAALSAHTYMIVAGLPLKLK